MLALKKANTVLIIRKVTMVNKHDEVITYINQLDIINEEANEDLYEILGERGEIPSDYQPVSIMLTLDTVFTDQYLNDCIHNIIYPKINLDLDSLEKSILEKIISKYVLAYFTYNGSLEYPVGALTRMILTELSSQNWIDDKFRQFSLKTYRNFIENWVLNILNPVLEYYFRCYSVSFLMEKRLMFFHKVNYRIGKHLILSFIRKQ